MASTYAELSESKNGQGYYIVENRSVATAEVAEERGLIEMPEGGAGWWYDDTDGTFFPPILTVAERKPVMVEQSETQYQLRLAKGFSFDGGQFSLASLALRQRILEIVGQINSGRGLPNGKTTKRLYDQSGTAHDFDATQILDLGEVASDIVEGCDDRLDQLKIDIEAATSHSDLDAIDVTSEWP